MKRCTSLAPAYALLGGLSCLAHFYAFRRSVPTQVPLVSVIHARQASDSFADFDGSQSLHLVVANTRPAAQYLAEAPLQALLALAKLLTQLGQGQQGIATPIAAARVG